MLEKIRALKDSRLVRTLAGRFDSNRIGMRLLKYFGMALLVLAAIMTLTFNHFFEENYVERTQLQMYRRALSVADIVREKDIVSHDEAEMARIMRNVNKVTDDDIWIAYRDGTVVFCNHMPPPKEDMEHMRRVAARMGRSLHSELESIQSGQEQRMSRIRRSPNIVFSRKSVSELPHDYQDIIRRGLKGETVIREGYDSHIEETTSYVTAPVYGADGGIQAVVVLRQPVFGLNQSLHEIAKIYAFCLIAAIITAFVIAAALSLKFTDPLRRMKSVASEIASGNYKARSYITQKDEIGQLAQTIDGMAAKLEKADNETKQMEKSRKIFISNISHELRTPVTVVRGSLEALRDKVVTDPAEVEHYYDTMYNEVLFQQRLINDLLELTRLQNPEFSIEKKPLNFCSVIRDAVRSSRHIARSRQVTVSADLDTDMYKLTGDYGRLNQMLLIFLDNAIKFSREGGSIEVSLKDRVLRITDHGTGIRPEDLDHIFERFYHTWDAQNKSGSGLGLTIARSICERHNIVCNVMSEYGKGTTIILSLPAPEPLDGAM
ncbi:MAG: HAMP domain-containing sensor histidine kinase [Succiniclasticum sp.]|jgi:signal transduction histidine kinase|nr:HAMP domain-containing sensor histidine kinase [Succiniclasticum sp.]MEE3478654.1 HAMP domain-containing sensor histidine kinase [Succiniclasticum sp.]